MASRLGRIANRIFYRGAMRRWRKQAARAEALDLGSLRRVRTRAREVRRQLDRVLYVADSRLTLPLISSNAMQPPLHSDWSHRPSLWRGPINPPGLASVRSKAPLDQEVTIYHDCKISEVTLRQIRNTSEIDLSPFGVRMDVFRFDGSFLSLVVALPDSAVEGLQRRHLVRVSAQVELEKPLEIFARLNIKHGPNTEQIVRELPVVHRDDEAYVEFDLAYSKLNDKRIERMWLDLIFEGPEMNQITIRDLTLSRRPRADF